MIQKDMEMAMNYRHNRNPQIMTHKEFAQVLIG
jgi:hypothetical protein